MNLDMTSDGTGRSACLRLAGDLDYVTTPRVVKAVSQLLVSQPELRHLHLDCETLAFCDSAGLSGLLEIQRQLSSAGVQLHLDNRPTHLERILQITGTIEHLTAPCDVETADEDQPTDISTDSEMTGSRGERNG